MLINPNVPKSTVMNMKVCEILEKQQDTSLSLNEDFKNMFFYDALQ